METNETGHTIVEAKNLYTQQLCELLSPHLYEGIKSLFDTCKENNNQKVLKTFQEKLCSVIKWNQIIIDKEYDRIISDSDCTWLSKLIDAVFISHVKVLSSVTMKSNSSINLKIPEPKNFIHKCYIECARYFYVDPSLIDDRETYLHYSEIQRNVKRSILAISNSIEKTIRELIPIQEILESYLNDNEHEQIEPVVQQELSNESDQEQSNENDEEQISNQGQNEQEQQNDQEEQNEQEEHDLFMEEPGKVYPDLNVSDGTTLQNVNFSDEIKNIIVPGKNEQNTNNNDNSPFFSDSDSDNDNVQHQRNI